MIRETLQKLAHLLLRLWLKAYHQIRVPRLKLDRPSVIVANHASHLDIAAIFASIPFSEIPKVRTAAARDHIFTMPGPIVSLARFLFNVFPFERRNTSADSLKRCEDYLREGCHVVMFPEGRRSPNGRFLGFTPGFAAVAYKTGAPVVPIRLDGTHRALPRGAVVPLAYPVRVAPRPPLRARRVHYERRRTEYLRLIECASAAISRP
ncbi:MAG: 1-acyl-sn-glycerol-3-phosphate acyltransferase [Planctomycetes bacterium]|nr:1-acyl-sn-glycerol-3-phosphate acyltransferase [Planctomycetota bacterium]